MRRVLVAAVMWIGLAMGAANAASPSSGKVPATLPPAAPPDFRITLTNLLVARYNPLGLEDQLRVGAYQRIYKHGHLALRDNYFMGGLTAKLNPAFAKIGPTIELQPLSILNLRVDAEFMGWFGSFNFLQSYGSPVDVYSDSALSREADRGRNYRTTGAHIVFEPLLQLKVGPIALRNRFSIEYWSMSVRAGDTVFYEPSLDTLIPREGWILSNDLDLLYLTKFRFVAGLRYSVVEPLYRGTDFRPGETRAAADNGHQRLGPLLAYTIKDKVRQGFQRPTIVAILAWYLDHRWRTGGDVNQGIPYVILGFAFLSEWVP